MHSATESATHNKPPGNTPAVAVYIVANYCVLPSRFPAQLKHHVRRVAEESLVAFIFGVDGV